MPELTEDVVIAPGVAEDTVDTAEPAEPNFGGWACPVPLRDSPTIVMGHGAGGGMMAGSMSLNTPARASTKPARVSRKMEPNENSTRTA